MVRPCLSRNGPRRAGRPPRLRGAVVGRRGAPVRRAVLIGDSGRSAVMADSQMSGAQLLCRGGCSIRPPGPAFMADPSLSDLQLLRRGGGSVRSRGAGARSGLFAFRSFFVLCSHSADLLHFLVTLLGCLFRISCSGFRSSWWEFLYAAEGRDSAEKAAC